MKKSLLNIKHLKIYLILILVFIFICCFFLLKPYFRSKNTRDRFDDLIIHNIKADLGCKVPDISKFVKKKITNNNVKINIFYDDWLVESATLNEVGTYQVEIEIDNVKYHSIIEVVDFSKPDLQLHDLKIAVGQEYSEKSFVTSCKDNSRKCTFSFENSSMANYKDEGTYDIKIIASDDSFNKIEKSAKLVIVDTSVKSDENKEAITDCEVSTKIEETVNETFKFGVKVTTVDSVYYEIDSNGNKTRIRSKTTSDLNRNNYNATTNELVKEAENQLKNNSNIISDSLNIINECRQKEKVSMLKTSDKLNVLATVRALEIGWSGKFSHTRPNGKSAYTIGKDLDYDIVVLAENIAKSEDYTNFVEVFNYWKDSLGNYKNIINKNYEYVGIGMVEIDNINYWVLLFSNINL